MSKEKEVMDIWKSLTGIQKDLLFEIVKMDKGRLGVSLLQIYDSDLLPELVSRGVLEEAEGRQYSEEFMDKHEVRINDVREKMRSYNRVEITEDDRDFYRLWEYAVTLAQDEEPRYRVANVLLFETIQRGLDMDSEQHNK